MREVPYNTSPLPEKWVRASIGVVAKVLPGYGFPEKYQGKIHAEIPFFKVRDISQTLLKGSIYLNKANNYITMSECTELKAKPLSEGTIVFAKIGEALKLNRRAILAQPSLVDNNVVGICTIPEVLHSLYAYYFLLTVKLENISRATTVPSVRKSDIEEIKIPIAPINEQRRIVAKVEELFSFLDAGIESLRKVQAQLKRYRQAVLKYAFEGKLTEDWRRAHKDQIESAQKALERASLQFSKKQNTQTKPEIGSEIPVLPDGWVHARLENFIYIAGRIGWRGLKADEYTEDGPLFLSVYNLNKGNIVDISETYHISEERYSESPEIQLRNDDILLAKDGAGIGKIGIVQGLTVKATVNSSLLVIRSGLAFKPKFLFYFFKGPRMQELVKSRITGSATPHLFQRDIRKFDLLIPPLLEQEQIIAEIESRFSVVDQVENIGKMSVKQAEHLRQTILKDAFDGKLVPQDSNDQPAEELLDCVKAECLSNRNSKSNNQLELSRYVK